MTRWNTGLAQGNTETNELGYKSGLKRILAFSECRTLPDFASIKIGACGRCRCELRFIAEELRWENKGSRVSSIRVGGKNFGL
jgi:hypothetical protein